MVTSTRRQPSVILGRGIEYVPFAHVQHRHVIQAAVFRARRVGSRARAVMRLPAIKQGGTTGCNDTSNGIGQARPERVLGAGHFCWRATATVALAASLHTPIPAPMTHARTLRRSSSGRCMRLRNSQSHKEQAVMETIETGIEH